MVFINHHRFLEDFHLPSPSTTISVCRPSSTYRESPPTITSSSMISTHLNQLGFQIRMISQPALSIPFYSSLFDRNQSIAPYAGQRCCHIGYTNRNTCDIYDDVVSHRRSHLPVTVCTSNHLVSFTQSVWTCHCASLPLSTFCATVCKPPQRTRSFNNILNTTIDLLHVAGR